MPVPRDRHFLLWSSKTGHPGISPHTLPYLGIQTYQKQLELGGFPKKAREVERYIAQRDRSRRQRRQRGIA